MSLRPSRGAGRARGRFRLAGTSRLDLPGRDRLELSDSVDAVVATRLHPVLLEAAEAERERAAAGSQSGDLNLELGGTTAVILLAAAAVESATHWGAADLPTVQDFDIAAKWRLVVKERTGRDPAMGSGLGQRVKRLADDRNAIAHYPGRGRELAGAPVRRAGGLSWARARWRLAAADVALATAREAIAVLALEERATDRSPSGLGAP